MKIRSRTADAVDGHLRPAEEPEPEDRGADPAADVHPRPALLVPPGFIGPRVEGERRRADEREADLAAVGVAGEDEVDALPGGRRQDDRIVAEGDAKAV